jgi:hypothetical protein
LLQEFQQLIENLLHGRAPAFQLLFGYVDATRKPEFGSPLPPFDLKLQGLQIGGTGAQRTSKMT